MNKKAGIYTGAIGLAAIALIITLAFNSVSEASAQESKSQAEAIFDLKWEMQNSQYLVGKSVADALADGTSTGCTIDESLAVAYATSALDDILGCNVTIVPQVLGGGNVDASATVTCTKDAPGLIANYAKTFSFSKKVSTFNAGGTCHVDVQDNDTGECEVDTIDTATTGIGCGN